MYFANPWGLLAALSIPAIIGIHFFRRRFAPKYVAGVFLWTDIAPETPAGRRRHRPPVTLSLLLELIAAAFLSLLIAEPRFRSEGDRMHLVFVLDNSASMSAVAPSGRSLRDRAIERLDELIDDHPGSVVTVLLTGPRPQVLIGPAAPTHGLNNALTAYRPLLEHHDMTPAFLMAKQVAGDGKITFLTDRIPPRGAALPNVAIEAVGEPLDNVGIVAAHRERAGEPADTKIFLRIANFSKKKVRRHLRLLAEGKPVLAKPRLIEIEPKSEVSLTLKIVKSYEVIEAILEDDALALDNKVTLVRPKTVRIRVANRLPRGRAQASVNKALRAVAWIAQAEPSQADLIFATPGSHTIDRQDQWLVEVGGDPKGDTIIGPYVLESGHPLLQGLTLEGVVWGGLRQTTSAPGTLVSSGKYSLLTVQSKPLGKRLALNIEMAHSNLHKSPAWPLLISNIVEARRSRLPQLLRWNLHQGEEFSLMPPGYKQGELKGPAGDKSPLPPGRPIRVPVRAETGLYEIFFDGALFDKFAVNFVDRTESNLTKLGTGQTAPAAPAIHAAAAAHGCSLQAEMLGAVAVLGLLFGNWFWLTRRRHVVRKA